MAHFQWHGGYVAGSGPKLKLDVSKQGTKDAKSKGKIKKDKMSQMSPEEYDKMLGKMKKTKKNTKDGGGRRNFIPKHVSAMITCPRLIVVQSQQKLLAFAPPWANGKSFPHHATLDPHASSS